MTCGLSGSKVSCFNRSGLRWISLYPQRFASGWGNCLYFESCGLYVADYIYCRASWVQHHVDVLTVTYVSKEPLSSDVFGVRCVEMQAVMYVLDEPLIYMSLVYAVWKCKQ
jgi:hypothetical protein